MQTYLMETKDGMLVWVPEDKLAEFKAAQRAQTQESQNFANGWKTTESETKAQNPLE